MTRPRLRCFEETENDLALLKELFFDPLFLKFMQPRGIEECPDESALILKLMALARNSQYRNDGLKILFNTDDLQPIGISGILEKNSGLNMPELSIYIRKEFRGLGFAKEGIRLTSQKSSISNYAAFVDFENKTSQKLMKSSRLSLTGIVFHRNLKREGLLYLS